MRILSLIFLLPLASFAQGYVQYVWHGNSNFFQASFILTDAEMQGAPLGSSVFTNSVSASSQSGILYNSKDDLSLFGTVNPWGFRITFADFSNGTELFIGSLGFPYTGMAGSIQEKQIFGSELYYENGYWTTSAIPEPTRGSLLVIGSAFLGLRLFRGSAANPNGHSRPPDA